ncbi:MAG: UbiA family prenyltransferase [Desulfobacteraceae bacterium]|nr:UbiA family prenyltransferase [Desulfobacteraceae bacterium]MCB9494037.1 UbiA family prenyltransferase [Desulfobacteraceae bacterium]
MTKYISAIKTYSEMIKISHTIFALPFALSAVVLASRYTDITFYQIFFIILAMTGARSAAMGFNRIADKKIDKFNPRTSIREIPSGKISLKSAWFFVLFSSALFIFSAFMLGRLCFYLSFPVLFILLFYSYTKRFTSLAHIYLGFAISLAPLGAFIALTNSINFGILILSLTLLTYISGFDILYSCQDLEFDRENNLFSIPAKLGEKKAFLISDILHLITFICLVSLHFIFSMNFIFLLCVILTGILLVMEHLVVRPGRMEKIDLAFFNINSVVSITLFLGFFLDELFFRWI